MRRLVVALVAVFALAGAGVPGQVNAPRPPRLAVRAPEELTAQAARIERLDTGRLVAVMRLLGAEDAGPPIPVFLVPEQSDIARETPAWVAGFAVRGAVVLFPARTPSYPHESLEELLQHEVAHVLIDRAAGGRPVARWFHEGVALAAEHTWTLGDRADFVMDVAFGGPVPASSIDDLFRGGLGSVHRAYRLSGLFVQELLDVHGRGLPSKVLAAMRGGRSFEDAFEEAAGVSVDEASGEFWRRRRFWATWLPWITSPAAVWTLITVLTLAAIVRVQWRRVARRRAAAAHGEEDGGWDEHRWEERHWDGRGWEQRRWERGGEEHGPEDGAWKDGGRDERGREDRDDER